MPSRSSIPRWRKRQRSFILQKSKGRKVMRRRVWSLVLAAPVVLAASLLATNSRSFSTRAEQTQASSAEVKIDNFSFGPTALTVAVGTTVTWTNRDDIPHTVVSTDKVFKSKVLDTDEKFSYTFTQAGSFPYFCSIHPKMTGKVVVK